jgi:hypothetical protein
MLLAEGSSSPTTIVLSAIVAALGYVGKQLWDAIAESQKTHRTRKSQIVEIQSLLRATDVSFEIQNLHAQRLLAMLQQRTPNLDVSGGYEEVFTNAYQGMTCEEKELHALIRSISVNALHPGNSALIAWLNRDNYFKAQAGKSEPKSSLASKLGELETHLILWQAKYQMWIADRPDHALVYMADEQNHGQGFPAGLDVLVTKVYKLM